MRKNEADHQRRMAKLSSNQKKQIAELESQLAERGAKLIKERSRRIKAEAQVADQRKVIHARAQETKQLFAEKKELESTAEKYITRSSDQGILVRKQKCEIADLKAQVAELMEVQTISEDNPWSIRENGHYGLDLFYGEVGIAHMSETAYAQLLEYMRSHATNKTTLKE